MEIELDGKLFYTILYMEDGNYIAANKRGSIFRLHHDREKMVKKIADKPIDFFEIYKGYKADLDDIMEA